MMADMQFSVDVMKRCSGNGSGDQEHANFFATEALSRATAATARLKTIADLESWGDNVRAEVESLAGLVNALEATIAEFVAFFDRKPAMQKPFTDVIPKLGPLKQASANYRTTIIGWLDTTTS